MNLINQLLKSAKTYWMRTRLALLTAWVALMIGIIPIPSRESGQGWVQPVRMQGIFAPHTARLEKIERMAGARVTTGDPILQLQDVQLQLREIESKQHVARAQAQLASWNRLKKRPEAIEVDIAAAENAVQNATHQALRASQAVDKLSLRAALDGKLISLPAFKLQDTNGREITPAPELWLDPDQIGRFVPQGTMLAAVHSRELLAVIPLTDTQLRDIQPGTAARLYLPSHSDRVWETYVQAIVQLEHLDTTTRLLATTQSASEATGNAAPANSKTIQGYAAVIELPIQDAAINCEVLATFRVPAKTLAARASDWAHVNLRWLIQ